MLGRPFLATARAIIDMKNGKLSLNIGEKKVEFNLSKGTTNPTLEDSYCQVEVIEGIREEKLACDTKDPLETLLLGNDGDDAHCC